VAADGAAPAADDAGDRAGKDKAEADSEGAGKPAEPDAMESAAAPNGKSPASAA